MAGVKSTVKKGINIGLLAFFNYETEKIVQINSWRIGIINRFIQLCIIAYIIGYVIVYKKGYQSTDSVVSGVITKVKGVSYVNSSALPAEYQGVWDVQSIVVPPMENNAFFVTTNVVITKKQTKGACAEDVSVPGAKCSSDADCPRGKLLLLGHGALTGRCVPSSDPSGGRACEVFAWCPIENDTLVSPDRPMFDNIPDYTVLIKNSIEFPRFKVKRSNVLPWMTSDFLHSCRFRADQSQDRFCPILTFATVFQTTGVTPRNGLARGAVIGIHITWNCDLDHGEDRCNPAYDFRRLDSPTTKIAKGWNYRYVAPYYVNGTEYRDLYKAYGVRFLIFVSGKAGKFDIIPLTMNIGSGLALLSIATLMCDMVVLYCVRHREKYRYAKYDNIEDDDALQGLIVESQDKPKDDAK